jgi:hypothetical protein
MPLQGSASTGDPLTLREIAGEFGNDGGISLRDYYRGGPLVSSGSSSSISTNPSSLTILQFLGASAVSINFNNYTISSVSEVSGSATAAYEIHTNGNAYQTLQYDSVNSTTLLQSGAIVPGSATTSYEVYVIPSTTALSTYGTLYSWLPLTSNRGWGLTYTDPTFGASGGNATIVLDFQLRATGGSTIIDNWQITLQAAVIPYQGF